MAFQILRHNLEFHSGYSELPTKGCFHVASDTLSEPSCPCVFVVFLLPRRHKGTKKH